MCRPVRRRLTGLDVLGNHRQAVEIELQRRAAGKQQFDPLAICGAGIIRPDGQKIEQRRLSVRRHARLTDSSHTTNLNTAQPALVHRPAILAGHAPHRRLVPAEPVDHHHEPAATLVMEHVLTRDDRILKKRRQDLEVVLSGGLQAQPAVLSIMHRTTHSCLRPGASVRRTGRAWPRDRNSPGPDDRSG